MSNKKWVSALGLLSQLGISMVVPIFMCVFFGIFLDDVTGHEPLWLIVFILLGVGASFRNLFYIMGKEVRKIEKDEKNDDCDDRF